ncbi:MAG: RluA family pseudouridine synthase [bacterium]|nr:RluA family pseudouridine synthase [bacterium]
MAKPKSFEIIFEDQNLIVVNKTSGLLTIPDRYAPGLPNLKDLLIDLYGDIFVVHRIDKDTSGLILFAKDSETHRELSLLFQNDQISKEYLALVEGHLETKDGLINTSISENPKKPGKMRSGGEDAKESLTEYTVLEEFKNYSLVQVRPKTGRTHQIRIHFQSIGHPLAVDPFYGNRDKLFLSNIKKRYKGKEEQEEKPIMSRLTLHAAKLSFLDPKTKEVRTFEASIHKDMNATLNQLRKQLGR